MKYYAYCKRNYDPLRAKAKESYETENTRENAFAILPKGKLSVYHPSFDYYFEIKEEKC